MVTARWPTTTPRRRLRATRQGRPTSPAQSARDRGRLQMDAGGNPFDGEITDGQIERWLDQFEPDERPHVLRLVEQFHYYSSARFTRLLHSLPERIAAAANVAVSYTHLRAHETRHDLVCRLLLE